MPWLPIYAALEDFSEIHEWLNSSSDLAFIVPDGAGKWRALNSLPSLSLDRYCLWHVQSGPLPLVQVNPQHKDSFVTDPWNGWQELRPGADTNQPFFGNHPGIIWLNRRPSSFRIPNGVGLSSLEWIGNHFRIIGNPAKVETEALWRSIRRWVQKRAKKVPRNGPIDGPDAEVFAFPSALALFHRGTGRDVNP